MTRKGAAPTLEEILDRRDELLEKLVDKTFMNPEGCWIWCGSTNSHGFGTISINGHPTRISRVAYIIYNGSETDDCCIHMCKEKYDTGNWAWRECWCPTHLKNCIPIENVEEFYDTSDAYKELCT